MATVRPFRGFRPLPMHAARVAARPYDVLNSEEARAEAAGNPLSFLHVGKPEIDLPRETSLYDASVYEKGNENLRRLASDGILKQDEHPSFYLYAQTMGTHTQYGIVGCVSVKEYLDGTIKKHELTRPDKEDDRTRHVIVTNAHTGPIFLTYHTEPHIDDIVDTFRLTPSPVDFAASDNVRHQLWTVGDPAAIRSIREAFQRVQFLYIADGHHRAAAAARAAGERAATNAGHTGNEEYNYFLAVLFPHNQVQIFEYNRVVKDLHGHTTESLYKQLKTTFDVHQSSTPVKPGRRGEFGMYLKHQWYTLAAHAHHLTNPDPVARLDVSILQHKVLAPIFGINDPRTDKRIDFVGGIRGLNELETRVDSGEMAVAFSLHPTSVMELLEIADAGKIMPPKSTWFEPKLRDGMVVHMLD